MEVCFIAGTLGLGGAERQLVFMLRSLQNEGVRTRLLCLTRNEAFESTVKDLGIEVTWVGNSPNRLIRLFTIIKHISKRPPDILQSSHFYTNIYAGAAGKILGIPTIGAVRNDLESEIAASGVFGRWQVKLPAKLIANSESAQNRARQLGIEARNVHYVSNVVEPRPDRYYASKAWEDKLNIVFVGRLVRQKNPELFINMASTLR